MDNLEFVKTVNALRLANKNKWYYFQGTVNGKDVQLKGYGTWLQIFTVNGWNCSNAMEQKVGSYKLHLQSMIEQAPTKVYKKPL